jgi:acyl transferase domain-containing protein
MDRYAALLDPHLDQPLLSLLFPPLGKSPPLHEPRSAHPTILSLELALAELWRSWGVEPDAVMGYGLGECAAACVAGALSLEDAIRLVMERGRLFQAARDRTRIDGFEQLLSQVRFGSPRIPIVSGLTGQPVDKP